MPGCRAVLVRSIESIPVSLPMRKPVVMAGEDIRRADNVLVRIAADNGVVGWGEAASAPLMTGETTQSIVAAVAFLASVLTGRSADDIEGALAALDASMYGNTSAKAAIEIALHDLVGRATGRPVHALLGGKIRDRMPVLGVLGGGDRDGDLSDAAVKKQGGVTIYKIKVGIDTPARDAERTRAICAALGSGMVISADANQGYSVDAALAYVRAVEGSGLSFFEQPVMAHDLDGMAAIAASTAIAIGADEGIHSLDDIRRHHQHKAARGVSLKAIKLGGLRALTQAARLCDTLGMSVNISCKTGESSIATAAALHAACVSPNLAWGVTPTNVALADDLTAQPVRVERGHVAAPDRPGLGIDVDDARVRHHQAGAGAQRVA